MIIRRVFIQLAVIGECNDKGKAVMSMGFKGKMIADPDRPLSSLAIPIIEQIVEFTRYSSADELKADFDGLLAYVENLGGRMPDAGGSGPDQPTARPPATDLAVIDDEVE